MRKAYLFLCLGVALAAATVFVHSLRHARLAQQAPGAKVTASSAILLELLDTRGRLPNGIYSLDPRRKHAVPRLFVAGGMRPVRNPTRTLVAYAFTGSIGVMQSDGTQVRQPACVDGDWSTNQPPVKWLCAADYAVVRYSPAVGTWMSSGDMVPRLYSIRPDGTRSAWQNVLSVSSFHMSPDQTQLVREVSPWAPGDLMRGASRLYVGKASDRSDPLGRRLTSLGEGTCENEPIWSPDGKWIAFTVVDLRRGYVAPAVCQPDGSNYVELLPQDSCHYQCGSMPQGKWYPVGPFRGCRSTGNPTDHGMAWRNVQIRPLEWSDDGKCLLLAHSDATCGVGQALLAECRSGRWCLCSLGLPGAFGRVALGPSDNRSYRVAATESMSVTVVELARADCVQSTRRVYMMPAGVLVRWLDW